MDRCGRSLFGGAVVVRDVLLRERFLAWRYRPQAVFLSQELVAVTANKTLVGFVHAIASRLGSREIWI